MAKRFKEEEIVKFLKEAEELGNVREVIRKHNVSEQSFYRWLAILNGQGFLVAYCQTNFLSKAESTKRNVGSLSVVTGYIA